jgi:nucleotide-binding universal stress UspA family protein
MRYQKILFATDFSESADRAFAEAAEAADTPGARLWALFVVPMGEELVRPGEAAPAWMPKEDKIVQQLRERYGSKTGVDIEAVVRYGVPARGIIEFAESDGADLIVIGARGVGTVTGFFGGGSVADKVVKNAKVPVLVVPS